MASYANEVSARRSSRILSHLQVFGVTSTIKIFGVDHDGVLPELEDEDMEYLLKVHETLADFKKGEKMTKTVDKSTNVGQSLHVQETTKASPLDDLHKVLPPERERKSTAPGIIAPSGLGIPLPKQETSSPSIKGIPLPEQETSSPSVLGAPLPKQKTSNPSIKRIPIPRQKTSSPAVTVIVNISEYVSYWALDTMFSEIGAQRKGVVKGNCLHYEFSEYNAVVKVLDGLRILDLKMEVQLHSGDKDEFVVHSEAKKGADILMGPLTRLKDWVVQTVKDKLMKELNVYTFKTEACSLGMQCDNKYNCPKYHDKADRRRNPKSYNYCVMRCSNLEGTGACDFEDRCYYLHSIQEKLLHFSCYKNEICTLGLKKCQEMKRTCYDAHSDEPDSFYHSTWEQPLYVKGLDRTLDYLAGAVRNLFKFHKLPGSKVLLITSTMGMAEFYARCIKDLAESYHQTVAVYDEKKKSCDGTIIIATEIPPLDYKRKKCVVLGKNIDLQTLKALIIDDGPAVLRNVPKNRIYDLQRIYGIEGLNIVVTAEEIINAEILHAFHMLGSRKSFKTIYFPCSATDDPTKQNKSPSSSTISNSENDKFSLSSSSRTRSDHSSQSPQLSLKDRIRMSSLHSMDSRSKNSPVMLGASSMKDSDDKSRFRTDGRKERYVDEKSSFRSHSRSISPPSRSRSPPSRSRSPLSKSRSPPSRSRSPSETQSRRRLPVRSKSPSETQSRKRLPVRSKSPSETQSKRRLPVRSKSPSIYRSKERSSPRPGSSSMFLESRGSPPRSRSMSEQSRRSPPRQKDDNHKQKILDEERRLECRKSTRKDDVEQSKAGGWKDLSHIEERLLKGGKSLQRCWKVFRAAFEELKVEYDREIELYTETPEVHPDYEEQYSSFIEYYKKEFTEKHDMTHCETLWEIYWKELISDMLEGEYRNKVEDLKREIVTPALNEAKENQKLNSKEESEFHKSRYTDHYGKIVTGETTGGSDVEEDSFIRNTFGLLQDACPFLGELSQDLMPLIYDIQMCIGDRTRFCELLQKSENIRLLKIVYNKCLEVSGRELSSELELKLQLAMVQIQRLLDFVEHINTKEKRNIKSEGSERSAQKYHRNQSPPLKSEPVTKSTRNQPRNQSPPYKSGLSDELAEAQHRNQGLKTSANVPQFSKEELQHLSYDPKEFSVKETVNILSEMSPCAGVLAPVLQILIGKLRDCMLDDSLMSSILSDKDNKMVLEMISEMFQKQSKRENNAIKVQKLELARSQMLRLLDYTNPVATKVIEVKPSVQIYTRIDNVQGSNTSQKHSTHSDSTRYFAQSSATISTLSQENCSISEYVFAKHYADKGASFNKDDLDNPIASTSAFGKEQKSGDSSTENFLVKSLILLEEVSSSFGLMGCVAQSLFQKIRLFWSDNRKVCEVITNRDNIILVKQVSERCKMLSENTTNPVQAKKYQWASILAMELLSYPDYVAKR